jgi:integrase
MQREQTNLRYLLEWAQDVSFQHAMTIRPTFPEYMLSRTRCDGKEGQLSVFTIKGTLAVARWFFAWIRDNEAGYDYIRHAWIKALKVRRLQSEPKTADYVTLEEIRAIAAAHTNSVIERRTQAALVFLYLSGIRIGAFVSLTIQAVDISERTIHQFPSLGVRTKNGNPGITYLFDLPDLLKIVQAWDREVRAILAPTGFWFAPLSPLTRQIDTTVKEIGEKRVYIARRNFRKWLHEHGLSYHSPHKFRHGHVQYGLQRAKNIADFKAISMNVMHASMEATDRYYSTFRQEELKRRITALSRIDKLADTPDVVQQLEDLLANIRGGTGFDVLPW